MQETAKLKILFLCTGNSCRSQMAEGWTRHLKSDCIEPYSAGIETHGLNPNAVQVMAEAGVNISGHKSKPIDEFKDVQFDYVVTVCGHANEHCPVFGGKTKVIHVGFDDPPKLAAQAINEQEALNCYRRVRDEIKRFVETLPQSLETNNGKLNRQQVQDIIEELEGNLAHPECLTCDCFQGFLTQLELDCLEDVSDLTGRFKVPHEKMHGCLGCESCPPGSRFAEYLKSQKHLGVINMETSPQKLDEQMTELIALGASVACNCHPCVQFHTGKARKLNIEPAMIQQAVEVGKMVRKGAAGQMDKLLENL